MTNKIIKYAVGHAVLTALYILGIATFLFNIEKIFGPGGEPDTALAPAIMLLLLVISAAITGLLVLARPLMWYLDGKKKEALTLVIYTLVALAIIALLLMLVVL